MGCGHDTVSVIQEACRIGKLAMAVLKRFDSSTDIVPILYLIYYGFVGTYSESVQSCSNHLYKGKLSDTIYRITVLSFSLFETSTCSYHLHNAGFECGLACGDTTSGKIDFWNTLELQVQKEQEKRKHNH